jgi:hypothetical protein
VPSFILPGAPCRDDSLLIQFSQRHSLTADAESTASISHTAGVPPMQTLRPETNESYVFMRIAIAYGPAASPCCRSACRPPQTHGRRTKVLLEALKISGTEQRDDPRFPSKKPPALARVLAAEMKSEGARADVNGINQIQQWLMRTIRLRNPDKCVHCPISPT